MNTNSVLLWIVGLGTALSVVRVARAPHEGNRGWFVILALILVLTGAAYLVQPTRAGYLAAAAWLVFVVTPEIGQRRLLRLVANQQYERARRLSMVLRLVHPFDGWARQAELMWALAAEQDGDLARADQILASLDSAPAFLRRQATYHRFRISRNWSGLVEWMGREVVESALPRDPVMLSVYLRALGETGDLNRLLSEIDRNLPTLEKPSLTMIRAAFYLYGFAFCGRTAAARGVLDSLLAFWGPELRTFWLATSELTANDVSVARDRLTPLARHSDVMIRRSAQDRLARALADSRQVLTPDSRKILASLEDKFVHEQRYSERIVSSPVRRTATWALVALNLAAFGSEVLAGRSEDPATLYRLGAAFSQGFGLSDSWRLLACTFLHFGPLHLLMNMIALVALGPFLERALGVRRYLCVYLASGILSGLAVVVGSSPALLVGASGSIMGIVGGTMAVLLRGWRKDGARPARRRLGGIALIVALQVAFDLYTPQVSFAVHLAGLIVGYTVTGLVRHWSWRASSAPAGESPS